MAEVTQSTEHRLQIGDVVITTASPESDQFSVTFKSKSYGTLPVKYNEVDDLVQALREIQEWSKKQFIARTEEN